MFLNERNKGLLVALLEYSERHGYLHHSLDKICEASKLAFAPGLVELVVEQLVSKGYIEASERCIDEPVPEKIFEPTIKLTASGLSLSETFRLLEGNVPASDRYVSLSDNEREAIGTSLSGLRDAIQGANDCAEDDRQRALCEIAIFEQAIVQPRVPTELIERFVSHTLKWIAIAFATAAVQSLAQEIYRMAAPLIWRNLAA